MQSIINCTENNYLDFYDLEDYLFSKVHRRSREQGFLDAADLFCIIIWKVNRAKSKIAKRLLEMGYPDLENASVFITSNIFNRPTSKQKMEFLMTEVGFRLPMASAILTVLYPDEFTVYDVRVCDMLELEKENFHKLKDKKFSDNLWNEYLRYKNCVVSSTPEHLSLREKDRYLWGKSFYSQLQTDLKKGFFNNDN